MNERIKELMKEANKDIPLGKPFWSALEEFSEKFAELIVWECADTIQKRYMGDNNREDMEVRRCVEDLKKHFGVEE
jgi:hypothetical protein